MVDLLEELKRKQRPDLLSESRAAQPQSLEQASAISAQAFGFDPFQTARDIAGTGQAAATIGSAALAEFPAGIAGAAEFVTGDAGSGAETVRTVQQGATFQPGQAGQERLQAFGQGLREFAQQPGIKQLVESGISAQDFITNLSEKTGGIIADPFSVAARAQAQEEGRELPPKSAAQVQGEAAGFAIGKGAPRAALEGLGLSSVLVKPGALAKTIAPRITRAADNVVDPRLISNVTRQGFDESITNVIANASRTDKNKLLTALNNFKRVKADPRLAISENLRPSNVAGDSVLDRFRVVNRANREAAKNLDGVAKRLQGQRVDQSSAADQFVRDLDDLGVRLDNRSRPNFKGSDIEGSKGAEQLLAKIITRMKNTPNPDAFQSHRLKKFIDEQVSFGKTAEGLSGKTEAIVKRLRRNIDQNLDQAFPEYNRVNTTFAETRQAIDALQDAVGRKVDLTGKNADSAMGTVLRRLMGNAQSRANLTDAINQIESTAVKQGARFDDDLATQLLFIDELDKVFGPTARTSLQGQGAQVAERVARGESVRGALFGRALEDVVEKVRGVNEEEAIKALEQLLKEGG